MNKKRLTGKVLGELESQIMKIIWRHNDTVSVRDITEILSKKRRIAYTTVMTIMGRLVEKGFLKRESFGKAYLYKASYSKDKFLQKISRQIIHNLLSSFGETAIAYFTQELGKVPINQRKGLSKILKT